MSPILTRSTNPKPKYTGIWHERLQAAGDATGVRVESKLPYRGDILDVGARTSHNGNDASALKRWFWTVACDNTVADPFVADAAELECDDAELRAGRAVVRWPPTPYVKATILKTTETRTMCSKPVSVFQSTRRA